MVDFRFKEKYDRSPYPRFVATWASTYVDNRDDYILFGCFELTRTEVRKILRLVGIITPKLKITKWYSRGRCFTDLKNRGLLIRESLGCQTYQICRSEMKKLAKALHFI